MSKITRTLILGGTPHLVVDLVAVEAELVRELEGTNWLTTAGERGWTDDELASFLKGAWTWPHLEAPATDGWIGERLESEIMHLIDWPLLVQMYRTAELLKQLRKDSADTCCEAQPDDVQRSCVETSPADEQ